MFYRNTDNRFTSIAHNPRAMTIYEFLNSPNGQALLNASIALITAAALYLQVRAVRRRGRS